MTRLPTPGGDDGTWGDILNAFLDISHETDGTLKANVVGSSQIQNNAVTNAQLDAPTQTSLSKADSAVQSVNGKSGSSITLAASDVSAVPSSQLGVNSGVAQLDSGGTLKASQVPGSVVSASTGSSNIVPEIWAKPPSGDNTGATDAANLQAWLTKLVASPSAIGILQAGTYVYNSALIVDKPVQIRGAGSLVTILKPLGAIDGFYLRGSINSLCYQSKLAGFQIDGTGGANSGIRLAYASSSVIEDVEVTGCSGSPGHGIYGDGVGSFNHVIFSKVRSQKNAGDGFNLVAGSAFPNNCELFGCEAFLNAGYGLNTNGTSTRVWGGWFADNAIMGMRLSGVSAFLMDPLVEGNWLGSPGLNALTNWVGSKAYSVGARVWPTDTTANPYTFQCTTAGTTGASEPDWSTKATMGSTITDGTVVWTNIGINTNGGAQIDDTGSNRCLCFYDNNTSPQLLMGMGNNVQMVPTSGGPGGGLQLRFSQSGVGPLNGVQVSSNTTKVVFTPLTSAGGPANIGFSFRPVGTGGIEIGANGPQILVGSGTPNGVMSAPVGSLYMREDGSAGTTVYVKEAGTGSSGWNPVPTGSSGSGTDVQIFNSATVGNATQTTATWTKPAGSFTLVKVSGFGGGGGGGSGGVAASGTVCTGGGGGGGGSKGELAAPIGQFAATETVRIGDGGAGAAGVAIAGVGSAGNGGGTSTMTINGVSCIVGRPGGGGGAGQGSGVAATAGTSSAASTSTGGTGGVSSATGGIGGTGGSGVAGGGAGGAGVSAANATAAGGTGGASQSFGGTTGGTAGAGSGGGVGGTSTNWSTSQPIGNSGGAGGGSEQDGVHNGGAGAAGGNWGGAGGGGGACRTGGTSGAGGNGAPGIVIVTTS